MFRLKKTLIVSVMFITALSLFAGGAREVDNGKDVYFASIVPQAYLLERIGGDRIEVDVMVPPGKSPATYEPTPQQMMALGEAKAFFSIGVPFENAFLPTVESSLSELTIVDAAKGIERRYLESHDDDEADHEEEHHHEEGTLDPHVWLSPVLAQTLSRNMAAHLMGVDPEGEEEYEANLETLLADLEALDQELMEILAPLKGETLFVYHPSFGYFADRYGMHQEAIETGGKEPSAAALEEIIHHALNEEVKVIIVQPEFSQSSAQAVAEAIGGAVIPVAPLHGDYINNLKALAKELKESIQ